MSLSAAQGRLLPIRFVIRLHSRILLCAEVRRSDAPSAAGCFKCEKVKQPEGAPSFRVLCERVGCSTVTDF